MAGEAVQAVYVYKKGNIRTLKPDKRRERIEKMKRVLIKKEDIKQYVFVIKELTAREIKRKYARSSLGIIWSVLNPLLMMIVMSLIFSTMFRHSIENYPIYYLTGTLFWDLFSGATNSAMSALVDNKMLLIKAKLPKHTFILSRIYTSLINFGYSCVAFALMLVVFGIKPSWAMLLLPVDVLFALIFSMGIGYMLSVLYVFFADVKYLYSVVLRVLMYMSAIFYPITSLPDAMQDFISYTPVFVTIDFARTCVMKGQVPEAGVWIRLICWSLISFVVGMTVFKTKENRVMQKI